MISDALSDAVHSIRYYLSEPVFQDIYSNPNLRAEIEAVVSSMDTLRQKLDALDWPPEWSDEKFVGRSGGQPEH